MTRKNFKAVFNFNKEILFGELGALVGAQSFGYISSRLTSSPNLISSLVVFGAIIFASLFWFTMRVYDKRRINYISKKLMKDVMYFTPASAFLTMTCYYPILFFTTRHLLMHNKAVLYSTLSSQAIAFIFFLIGINIYRYALLRLKEIEL